jgi:hypothetical protein
MPTSVWRSKFGTDRGDLIGHPLDADKLERKISQQMSNVDLHHSILEPLFSGAEGNKWILGSEQPSMADLNLFFMTDWTERISRGELLHNLTGGDAPDGDGDGMEPVFNKQRYPGLLGWFERMTTYLDGLKTMETRLDKDDSQSIEKVIQDLKSTQLFKDISLLPTSAPQHTELDTKNGLVKGAVISVAPDDTGRGNPTIGELVTITPEEVVIKPVAVEAGVDAAVGEVRLHFPRLGFVIKPASQSRH